MVAASTEHNDTQGFYHVGKEVASRRTCYEITMSNDKREKNTILYCWYNYIIPTKLLMHRRTANKCAEVLRRLSYYEHYTSQENGLRDAGSRGSMAVNETSGREPSI